MARRRRNMTKLEIIGTATELFLEKGYSNTSPNAISEELDISTGNLTYYFPTKEYLLAELVDMLCTFQWKLMEEEAGEGISSIMALCLELISIAAACEQDEAIKDFFISSYQSPICLDIIRRNDAKRAKEIFADHRPDWTDEQFAEAEILVSGIEYGTLMTAGTPVKLETRISGALYNILGIYGVPEDVRNMKLEKMLAMDYRGIGLRVLAEFKKYVADTNQHALDEVMRPRRKH